LTWLTFRQKVASGVGLVVWRLDEAKTGQI